jgi:hypothetical protein
MFNSIDHELTTVGFRSLPLVKFFPGGSRKWQRRVAQE